MGGAYSHPEIKTKWLPDFVAGMPSVEGRTVAITGTTSGIGKVAARVLVSEGATVFTLNRPSERATASLADLQALVKAPGSVSAVDCDLQDFDSVRKAAGQLAQQEAVQQQGLDVLCNNAGVMWLPDKATRDGHEQQMQTNHLSHFLLTSLLMPSLERAAAQRGTARVVNHSSVARKNPHRPLDAANLRKGSAWGGDDAKAREGRYQQTKLANMAFTCALQEKLQERASKVVAVCATPGVATTALQITSAGAGYQSQGFMNGFMRFAQTEEDGAMPLLHCIGGAVPAGKLCSPKNKGLLGCITGDGWTGPPAVKEPEPLGASREAMDLLWEESEKACGPFFNA